MNKKNISNKKTRRNFLKSAAAASGSAALLTACGSASEPNGEGIAPRPGRNARQLNMVTTWPKNFPGMGVSAERFASRVREATEGQIDITVYAAGELVPALGAFDAVSLGNADIYHAADYYWQGKSKAFNFFCAVPFGMTTSETAAWIHHDGGQALWDELGARFNIKALLGGSTGVQMGGWFRDEISTLEDLKGLRIRIPGLGGEVYSRLGATPVTKAGGEIFLALSQGNIDATEWVGPWNDLAFGFHEIVKYYYYPGFHEPGTSLAIGFNKQLWDSLDGAEQAIIESAALAEHTYTISEYDARNAEALKTLIDQHGVQLRRFSDEILREFARISAEVLDEVAANDELTSRVYQSYKASMGRTMRWGEISEQAYAQARALGGVNRE
jgi:TRAP-type mannitol/chloroaromatic compound transport system substrate-binding protein